MIASTFTDVFNSVWSIIWSVLCDYWPLISAVVGLVTVMVVFIVVYGKVKRRRKNAETVTNQKILPTISKLLGFDPYTRMNTVDRSGSFYAIASSVASAESALEVRHRQKTLVNRKIKEIKEEKSAVTERIGEIESITEALKVELANELGKGRKKNKSRVADIESEIKSDENEIVRLREDCQFCDGKIAMCEEARLKICEEISLLEANIQNKKENLKSTENKNGATYEEVRLYEKGMDIIRDFPKVKELLQRYVFSRVTADEVAQKVREYKIAIARLKSDVKQLYSGLEGKKDSSVNISKLVSKKNKEIDETTEALSDATAQLEELEETAEIAKKALSAAAAESKLNADDLIFAESSMIALRKYKAMGVKLEEDLERNNNELLSTQKEYEIERKAFEKCKKRDGEKKAEIGKRMGILAEKMAGLKTEIDRIESLRKEYPSMTPAAFYKSGESSMLQIDTKNSQDYYKSEIEKIKREYVDIVKGSLDLGGREAANERKKELLKSLEQLERRIYAEKTSLRTKAITMQYRDEYGMVNQRKIQIVTELEKYKSELKNIDSIYAANEYRNKLRRFASTLSEDDLNDANIANIIKRCLEDAKLLGEQAQSVWNRGGRY